MPNVQLIATAEVARLIGRDVSTVHRMVRSGQLTPAAKAPGLRGSYLFRSEDVEALLVPAPEATA